MEQNCNKVYYKIIIVKKFDYKKNIKRNINNNR